MPREKVIIYRNILYSNCWYAGIVFYNPIDQQKGEPTTQPKTKKKKKKRRHRKIKKKKKRRKKSEGEKKSSKRNPLVLS